MSDILRIRTLTDRFFDGTTTLEEEHELYDYYRREQALPADLAQLRRLFLDFAAVQFADEPAAEQQEAAEQPSSEPASAGSTANGKQKDA